ncbi:polyribonucleotide nucleotidyltransferase [Pseudomonas sp. JDS28PS106]|uniref:polyribonucleotide nucleotidyltransferase n=1 Tax=Pseudomonas sp. JDS28PS106 TaxID=2497235 RepID=UPI002FD3C0CF
MFRFDLKAVIACLALLSAVAPVGVQAETKAKSSSQATVEKVSVLDGKLSFTLPAGFKKDPMPEIDAKAVAQGVTGSLYTHQAEKRVLIITEMPIPMGVEATDNDAEVLDGLLVGQQAHQSGSYKDFKKLAEKKIVKKNGLGVGQLDTSVTMSGAPVLSTTLVAASGKRAAILNVVSRAANAEQHKAMVKTVIGE